MKDELENFLPHRDPDSETERDETSEWGCCFPGECLMPGEHMRGECHTAAMVEAYEQAHSGEEPVNEAPAQKWTCKADRSGVGGNDPQDCDWPCCGCDPYAEKVIAALEERGLIPSAPEPPKAGPTELRWAVLYTDNEGIHRLWDVYADREYAESTARGQQGGIVVPSRVGA